MNHAEIAVGLTFRVPYHKVEDVMKIIFALDVPPTVTIDQIECLTNDTASIQRVNKMVDEWAGSKPTIAGTSSELYVNGVKIEQPGAN